MIGFVIGFILGVNAGLAAAFLLSVRKEQQMRRALAPTKPRLLRRKTTPAAHPSGAPLPQMHAQPLAVRTQELAAKC